jgi:hypothetical protein
MITTIGEYEFSDDELTGTPQLPPVLRTIGVAAFRKNLLSGTLEIPPAVKVKYLLE